ncbi:MAG: hypothetical protein HWE10_06740 [Gammaproteobacteria bacterium]|nr:hypothetical protein [Gammaproteobacteria bacterium]
MGSLFRQQKRKRTYAVKKTGIKDENIDRQIIVIHRAIAEKLIAHPILVDQVKSRLEEKRDNGSMGYGHYITWQSILELRENATTFIEAMTEDSQKMRRMRRSTPFTGILTEEERVNALKQDAFASVDSIDVLF